MFLLASLSVFLLQALFTGASPVEVRDSLVTLSIARQLNLEGGTVDVLQHDLARAASLQGHHKPRSISSINNPSIYTAKVSIGSPATVYDLVVDTGSSNTWVGAGIPYVKTKTSVNTGQPVSVGYGTGAFDGTIYTDTVKLGRGLIITKQTIGVASDSTGFTDVDGILGLGPVDLTEGSLPDSPTAEILTVTQNLFLQGEIPEMVVSVSFEPSNALDVTNGEVTFGGTDSTKYTGEISYVPVTSTKPASSYWGIEESITYGTKEILSKTVGIVDTGTTFVLIASEAFNAYKSATGGTMDDATQLLRITNARYAALENLNFKIGSETYSLTPNAQIWPRSLNTYIGGSKGSIYLIVTDIGTPSGTGLDFINGYTFLERFYSVYDTTNSRVGFAKTAYTDSTNN